MGRGPELAREQRLIIYKNAAAGAPKETCDAELRRHGFPPVNDGSYQKNVSRDGKLFRLRPDLIERFAEGPIPYGEWPQEWKDLARSSKRSR
jgi:hypothetical protein